MRSKRLTHSYAQVQHDAGECNQWTCVVCIAERDADNSPPWYTAEEVDAMAAAWVALARGGDNG